MEEDIQRLKQFVLLKDAQINQITTELQQYKDIVSYFPGIIVVLNKFGIIEFINENGAKILGYSVENLIGKNWFDKCIPENVRENLKFVFSKIIEGYVNPYEYYENPVMTKYRTIKLLLWRNAYIQEGTNIVKTISFGTEVFKKDFVPHETEKVLARIFNLLPEAVHIIDTDYTILYCNETMRKWCRILGFETDMVNKKLFDVYPFLDEKIRKEYQRVFNTGEILITKEENLIDEKKIITEARKIPIFERENVIHVITLMREITDFLKE